MSSLDVLVKEPESAGEACSPSMPKPGKQSPLPPVQIRDLNWKLVFLLYSAGALISAGTVYTADLAEHNNRPYFYPLIWEVTGYYIAFLFAPIIVWLFARFPVRPPNRIKAVLYHVVFSIIIGVLHTLMMGSSRQALYSIIGLGTYDYGHLGYRILMEYHKQALHYWLIYAILRVIAQYRQSRRREREAAALELRTSELQRELAQVQLDALRSQLNPHFLFNTLNMISAVMYEDVNRADHMIASLSRMLRMSLEQCTGSRVPLRWELEFVNCAVDLLKARFQDRLEVAVQSSSDALDVPVPTMMLHTFLENAMKHHDFEVAPVIRFRAQIERRGSRLNLTVEDNGPGMPGPGAAGNRSDNGVGLKNLEQRLASLYGADAGLEFENRTEGGLTVRVSIPVEQPSTPAAV